MKRASTWIIVALSLVIIALSIWLFYLISDSGTKKNTTKVTSFATCVAAGNAVMESSPRQCRDATTGTLYVEEIDKNQTDEQSTRLYTSIKGVGIELNDWSASKPIASPLTVTGRVPGNWSFEASFGVELTDDAGNVISQVPATLQADWMTDEMVPFTVTLNFAKPASSSGFIILLKSNPSGLEKNDDSLKLPVSYK